MRKYLFQHLRYLFLLLLFPSLAQAQIPLEKVAESADSLKMVQGEFVRKIYVLPIITASPETSLQFGAVGIFLFRKRGTTSDTQLSSMRLPISYTLNKQFRAKLGVTYYSNSNKHILAGTVEWFKYPLYFYGVGNDTRMEDEEIYTTQTIRFDVTYLKSLAPKLYAGLGYAYFSSEIVDVVPGGQLSEPGVIPGNTGSITSGINLNVRYDSRDNNLSATKGFFIEGKIANFEPWMGSEFDYTRFEIDFRKYFSLFTKKHVLAMQLILNNTWGDPSFETMALLGGKTMMRGHYEGRFRDRNLYAAQVEYRIPIGRTYWIDERKDLKFKERWGLVGFVGVGDVYSSINSLSLSSIKTSAGVGIRFLVLPKERINIRMDFGFGSQIPAFYFSIREAF